jgi:epoxyqueuosine reductase
MELKQKISEISRSLGFQRTVIAGLEPMEEERAEFMRWLNKGYAASMEYLKRNPYFRTSPQLLYPGSRTAIIVFASYYTEVPDDPGPLYGRVAGYAVGLDYHAVLRARLRALKAKLEKEIGGTLIGKAYTDDVALYEQAFARRAGLGFVGKHTLLIGPDLIGSYLFVAELFSDLDLEPDQPYEGTCGKCFRCGDICPTKAIVAPKTVNAGLCISYQTIENRQGIPRRLRAQFGEWVFGCDLCQEVCPYNQRPPATPWAEFHPESGVGHYLELTGLLALKDEDQFRSRFGHTPLRRPKLRGLTRNALVVLGNRRPEGAESKIGEFALANEDVMLKEHAAWALSRYETARSRQFLDRLYEQCSDEATKKEIGGYLD